MTFECRGCEFVDFKPDGPWAVDAAEATEEEEEEGVKIKKNTWEEVEIEGFQEGKNGDKGEWFEYDDANNREVSIKVVSWEIRR